LVKHLESGASIGVDPFLIPVSQWTELKNKLDVANMKLVGLETNLVDSVWGSSQPDRPNQPIVPLELQFTGKSWEDKVHTLEDLRV
jgi:hypothetical protein